MAASAWCASPLPSPRSPLDHCDTKTAEVKHLRHVLVGPLALRFENLNVASAPGQHLVVHHADPGSPEERALAVLRTGAAAP